MGGVGGVHLATLMRLGISRFHIADPDVFEVVNFNRQYGALVSNIGKSKVDVMLEIAKEINPDCEIKIFKNSIHENNVKEFLEGCDLFVDAVDAFVVGLRYHLFETAKKNGIYSITAGPMGFSTAWLCFSPQGMSFSEYTQITPKVPDTEKVIRFLISLAPSLLQMKHIIDRSYINLKEHRGPSVGSSCMLSAGVIGVESIKILLGRGKILAAPYYNQFDPWSYRFVSKRLFLGNRNPLQKLKIFLIKRKLK
jgi:molybdopterin/thiamine biosynthesis adenylyltransferase